MKLRKMSSLCDPPTTFLPCHLNHWKLPIYLKLRIPSTKVFFLHQQYIIRATETLKMVNFPFALQFFFCQDCNLLKANKSRAMAKEENFKSNLNIRKIQNLFMQIYSNYVVIIQICLATDTSLNHYQHHLLNALWWSHKFINSL